MKNRDCPIEGYVVAIEASGETLERPFRYFGYQKMQEKEFRILDPRDSEGI
jgi:hypothetical protein